MLVMIRILQQLKFPLHCTAIVTFFISFPAVLLDMSLALFIILKKQGSYIERGMQVFISSCGGHIGIYFGFKGGHFSICPWFAERLSTNGSMEGVCRTPPFHDRIAVQKINFRKLM